MIILFSPTKTMTRRPAPIAPRPYTERLFTEESAAVRRAMEEAGPEDRAKIWGIRDKLLAKAEEDFSRFSFERADTPALFAYTGLQYKNLDAPGLSKEAIEFLKPRLYILSALYGLVRADDPVMAYRLEMKSKLEVGGMTTDLASFWRPSIGRVLAHAEGPILFLCSEEYAQAVPDELRASPRSFQAAFGSIATDKKGARKFRSQATRAKMARGQMLRWIAENQIDDPEDIVSFSSEDLRYEPSLYKNGAFHFIG